MIATEAWGILWRSENNDGKLEHLVGEICAPHGDGHPVIKPAGGAQKALTFQTRADARAFIAARFGYIAGRPDLQDEPHGWKMPIPVKVCISVQIAEKGRG